MSMKPLALVLLPLLASAADLPSLRTEPIGGGSVFFVKNTSSQPLTAYLIELVDYPGSSYFLWQDEAAGEPLAPGAEKRIQVTNMTAGAVPDYMKITGAIYADGSMVGGRALQILARRRVILDSSQDLISRLGTGATAADLKQWAASLEPVGKVKQSSQPVINQAAARALVSETASYLEKHSSEETVAKLRASVKALAASRPPL
jgi:hypothetical protein